MLNVTQNTEANLNLETETGWGIDLTNKYA
jgi:hypothetical protein